MFVDGSFTILKQLLRNVFERCNLCNKDVTAATYPNPLVTPVVALFFSSFIMPQIDTAPHTSFYADTQQAHNPLFQTQQAFNIQEPMQPQQAYTGQQAFQPQQAYSTPQHHQNPQSCSTHQCFQTHAFFTSQQPAFTPQTHFQYGMTSDPTLCH